MGKEVVDELYEKGREILDRLVVYLVDFAREFENLDITRALKSQDNT